MNMSAIDEILGLIPMEALAGRLGVDPATAEAATRQALPALLGGMQANAQDAGGEASLAQALGQHDSALVEGGVDLDQVDPADGSKIVGHVFGENHDQVINQLGGVSGGSGLIRRLLPILAPIVMSYLARRMFGGHAGSGAGSGAGSAAGANRGSSGAGLGDILGRVLGGAMRGGSSGGVDLGDLLGGLLGAGRR